MKKYIKRLHKSIIKSQKGTNEKAHVKIGKGKNNSLKE